MWFLKKYVLNIGIRQEGRVSEKNVIHTSHNKNLIIRNINRILKKTIFKKKKFNLRERTVIKNIKSFILKNLKPKELVKKIYY